MGSGADQIIPVKDAQSKANIASLETKAKSGSRVRDIEAAYSEPIAARRIRNEAIGGVVLLVCIVVAFFILFFVIS
jgi:hypothetical protein